MRFPPRTRPTALRLAAGVVAVAQLLVGVGVPAPSRAAKADAGGPFPCAGAGGSCCCATAANPSTTCGCKHSRPGRPTTASCCAKPAPAKSCCAKPTPPAAETEPEPTGLRFVPAWVPVGCQGQPHGPAGLLTCEPAVVPSFPTAPVEPPDPPRFARFDLTPDATSTPPADPPPRLFAL